MKFRFLLVALAATAWAQSPKPIQLQVLSATVNLESHQIAIEVQNQSSKVVTAYILQIKWFDAGNKLIAHENVGLDGLAYEPDPARPLNEIQPGAISAFPIGVGASEETVSAKASVIGVVYADRTFEGSEAEDFFVGRANDAKESRRAIALLQSYPATPGAVRAALETLRAEPHAIGLGAVANGIHLSAEAAGGLLDKRQALPDLSVPSKQQWNEIIADLSKRAAFLEAESQEVRP